jgi:RNA-directed DNA polymerase
MTVKMYFEPRVEPYFYPDSYGYRPGKSALEAITRYGVRLHKFTEYDKNVKL